MTTPVRAYAAVRFAAAVFAAGAMALAGTAAYAWDADGHQQIADIAWTKLTPEGRRRVAAILDGSAEPGYRPKGTGEDTVRRAFREAACFPDDIRNPTTATHYAATVESENHALPIDLPAGSGEASRCKTWHYYDTPIRLQKGDPMPAVDRSNALAALTRAEARLEELNASGKDPEMQFWYLAWILHLVGDLHQPLHCVSSYEFSPKGDAGGNYFHLAPDATGRPVGLHYLWDTGIAMAADYSGSPSRAYEMVTRRWMADPALQPSDADASNLDVKSWIDNGAHAADTIVYTGVTRGQAPSADYLKREEDFCRKQAVLAGVRLAAVINAAVGS